MSEVKALREEVAELRKQITAMAVAMAELASHQPQFYYWPQPVVTWNQQWTGIPSITCSTASETLTNS